MTKREIVQEGERPGVPAAAAPTAQVGEFRSGRAENGLLKQLTKATLTDNVTAQYQHRNRIVLRWKKWVWE
jgi:hypothetical protein